jgi:SP family sugar:H+ symporter-like MFS transporter
MYPSLVDSHPRLQYDTGQISDLLLMDDFLLRFGTCTGSDASSCAFSNVRAGTIVSLLSIGTLIGALIGAP